jgi:hypothetical protein
MFPRLNGADASAGTLSGPLDNIAWLNFQSALKLQSQIAGVIFGDDDDYLAVDYLPFYIASAIEDNKREVLEPVLDMLFYITRSAGFWRDANPVSASAMCRPGALDLIALWPLKDRVS